MRTVYVDEYRFSPEWTPAERDTANLLRLFVPHAPSALRAHAALADSASRKIFRQLLLHRMAHPKRASISTNAARAKALKDFMGARLISSPLHPPMADLLGFPIEQYQLPFRGDVLTLATTKYSLYWAFCNEQYHLQRPGIAIEPEAGDTVIDCGCYTGDTSIRFALDVGQSGRVISLDPSEVHMNIARSNAKANNLFGRTTFLAMGVSDRIQISDSVAACTDLNPGRRLSSTDSTTTIDALRSDLSLDSVDYIKMDVEGSEVAALRGAHDTITSCRPKMAVCVYHKPGDLWEIPNYIRARYPFYRLFLDHHSLHDEETVLYAVADR